MFRRDVQTILLIFCIGAGTTKMQAAEETVPTASTVPVVTPEKSLLFTEEETHRRKVAIHRYLSQKAETSITVASLPNPDQGFWWAQKQYDTAKNPKALHLLVGQHLIIAHQLLNVRSIDYQRVGIGLARMAAFCSFEKLKNNTLAADICDAYLAPNYYLTTNEPNEIPTTDEILKTLVIIYSATDQKPKMIQSYNLLIENARSVNKADAARLNLAQIFVAQKQFKEALKYLQEIGSKGNMAGARKLIAQIEAQAKQESKIDDKK